MQTNLNAMNKLRSIFVLILAIFLAVGCSTSHGGRKRSASYRSVRFLDSPSRYDGWKEGSVSSWDAGKTSPDISAGQLTAGEVNDFTKWKLWEDIDSTDLASYNTMWKLFPENRFVVQVTNSKKLPVHNATAVLLDHGGSVVWSSRTDNTGKAELWAGMYGGKLEEQYSIKIIYHDNTYPVEKASPFNAGINFVEIPVECSTEKDLDIAFMIDATGSMSDEISYLQAELADVIARVKDSLPGNNVRLAIVFYRDEGDDFVVKMKDFTSNIPEAISYLKSTGAAGGGDFPEAVDQALNECVDKLSWSDNAVARILFPVLDAPPHETSGVKDNLHRDISKASTKGVRIAPLACSGIDKSTEYLLRSMALATNGTYVFLTDHSGIGNDHIEPTTDEYQVELLNNALVRIILSFSSSPDCGKPLAIIPETPDTTEIQLPEVKEIAPLGDSAAAIDSVAVSDSVTTAVDSALTETTEPAQPEISWRYYPNPTGGPVTVEIFNLPAASEGFLYLTDLTGKLLNRYEVKESYTIQVDISQYPTGTYYLTFFYGTVSKLCAPLVLVH